jgi:hypothetical protein
MAPTIRSWHAGDEALVLDARRRAGLADSELARWRSAYLSNPSGPTIVLAVEDGRLLGGLAGISQPTWLAEETRFTWLHDAFLVPEAPATLERDLAQAFAETFGGRKPGTAPVLLRWSNDADWKRDEACFELEIVRTQTLLVRRLEEAGPSLGKGVERLQGFDEQVKWLWDRLAAEVPASTIRDARWCTWRFLELARRRPRILGVRDARGLLRGLAVLARGELAGVERDLLLEWLVPHAELEVGEILLAAACSDARSEGARVLTTLIPDPSPWFDRFQRAGFRVEPADLLLTARSFHRRYDTEWLRDHWWHTLADTQLL